MRKVLLLNPPASAPVFRDCYCSGPTKGTFFIHPLDLQIQSGFLAAGEFEPEFLDCIIEQLNPAQALQRINDISPHAILALVSNHFVDEELEFFRKLKEHNPDVKLCVSGDIARFKAQNLFERGGAFIDGILMNFCSPGLVKHLQGLPANDLLLPDGSGSFSTPQASSKLSFPLPWESFAQQYAYELPFFKNPRFYSLLTTFGCPYLCKYCNAHQVGFSSRSLDEVIDEIEYAASLGFKSIYFRDATFLANRKRTMELFDRWQAKRFDFEWMCFTRPELVDEEIAERAAELQCKMMMIGVESYDAEWLTDMNKSVAPETTINTFEILRKFKIGSAAEIMVGMANDSTDLHIYQRKLKQFISKLDPDFIALGVFERRPGVESNHPSFERSDLRHENYKELAETINRWFYMQPQSMLRKLKAIHSLAQLRLHIQTALHLIQH